RNSFSNFITDAQLTELGIDGNLRPENLSLEQFVTIANWLADQQQA
ncbi:16S rRNA (adenine(1518)-N(6)/adenine(1519)-N(6))-dimethyltransferase, partial [Aeromonas sp. CPF2-S1]|nr:16S rRNA (adenine(1518)-N(6)/adenine(1519)-N(6))-dimethyltransferase [Aeromonas sp. CPF2-S1]